MAATALRLLDKETVDKQKALEAGFDAHMVKPTDLDALLALLAKSQN